jgi:pyruvate/2-oxoglutarate dehydrogenase complex dihydrolipoamide dehydrogenase (E3) component
LLVLGGGPIGLEMAQAYRRLGAEVTVIGPRLLPKEEPEAQALIEAVLEREGIRIVKARISHAARIQDAVALTHDAGTVEGDLLLVATGRRPNVEGLGLEQAGVESSARGIAVDRCLRTSARHIYAAGDVLGGEQFTHLAGWQAFQAARNALLPGNSAGVSAVVPRVTFVDPEVAQVGLTEEAARLKYGDPIRTRRFELDRSDRAICEGETAGFIKVNTRKGRILGATIVASRAGEMIGELALAMRHGLKLRDLAATIHAYPTWSTAVQQVATADTMEQFLGGSGGRTVLWLAGL